MAIHCSLHHRTSYHYSKPVRLGPQVVRLRPAAHSRTEVPAYSLRITPEKHFLNWQQDPQGNFLARIVFPEPVRHFTIEVDLIADLATINPFDFFLEESAEQYPFQYADELKADLAPYLKTEINEPKFNRFFASLPVENGMKMIDFIVAVNRAVSEAVGYQIRMEPGVQDPEETLTLRSGSCRDSAWLLTHIMRRFGFATRFCSGYLIQLKADQKSTDGSADGPEEDFTDLHAWAEVFLPGAGWVGLDPTSGLMAGEGHIPLSATAHYSNAAPVTGGLYAEDDIETTFDFDMKVARVRETPRVTLPYTEEQVASIESLGHEIDRKLEESDIRLTMGGEPTFVSATDMEADEWNTDALGPTKALYADQLLRRLYRRFCPGGFLHHGQGKWYPGEPLPRWAYSAYWRTDGVPIWNDLDLIANHRVHYGFGDKEAKAFVELLTRNLGLPTDHIRAGYEDLFYYLWKERRLPMNVSVDDPRLDDKLERETLAKVFDEGLDQVTGYLLPLARGTSPEEWMTGPWYLRGEEMFLAPGNHPMGFRLPMDGLPWAERIDQPILEPSDPSIPRSPFPPQRLLPPGLQRTEGNPSTVRSQRPGDIAGNRPGDRPAADGRRSRQQEEAEHRPELFESLPGQVRTGLCVEPRDGRLHVFMPPVVKGDDYLELVATLEETAKSLGTPIRIEGYRPPSDPRIASLSVTPDPGVIEVNIHPSSNWTELVDRTRSIYDEARSIGLGTEKFLQDGRHSGTGGGNHIVVGGSAPLDSPFLRRPDLLPSLVRYFNNHPSLSYLFSGLFIGPTSQAPRLDECRHETLYEVETALNSLPKGDTTLDSTQWIIDRALRNHLVDLTGNTHRVELCIDKLFSPDSTSGRLGLVEMRGFEMPPHADMSLAQQLLIRGLLARFWDEPYTQKLVRWGTSIHDKWMLPHFIRDDMREIVGELNDHGFAFDPAWFEPHHEFRFPRIGELSARNIDLELRQAIEPWHVLGEEQGAGGTSRYVDSSVERVQVKLSNITDPRHVLTCNGVPVPLHPTGRNGEFVAGIRYRAWSPFSALHPTKPIDSPLTFDLVDTWNSRSIGGCRYHVTHPGGRAYDDIPLNAFVAETRRRSRFSTLDRSPGRLDPSEPQRDKEYPMTLDLQRHH